VSHSTSDRAPTRPAQAANNLRADQALDAWSAAAQLVARWLDRRERVDALLETLPNSISGPERARCQHLFLGVVRHFGRLDSALGRLIAHPPRFTTHAILLLAGFEILESAGETGRIAKTVHHAVERTKRMASPAEAKLVNAVVRKLAPLPTQPAPLATDSPETLAEYFPTRRGSSRVGPRNLEPQRPAACWSGTNNPPPSTLAGAARISPGRPFSVPPAGPDFLRFLPDTGRRSNPC
jgi:16S rRNA (cytosine967-C5)-methyltransferase